MPPRKRNPDETAVIPEPRLSEAVELEFARGVELFNTGKYWEAHEAWEGIWRELHDGPEDDWEIVLRGLIQVAAGLYCITVGKLTGAMGNLKKGKSKLELYEGKFLGIDLSNLVTAIESSIHSPEKHTDYQIGPST